MIELPTITLLDVRGSAASIRGLNHSENQDAWLMVRSNKGGALYAVCDGVSSARRGRWAAQHTCRRLRSLFHEDFELGLTDLQRLIGEVDWELREGGRGDAACTLSLVWLKHNQACTLHIGDSSIFRIRSGRVSTLSQEMSRGAQLISYMGMGPVVSDRIEVRCEAVHADDAYVLVTDGVSRLMRPTELAGWWLRCRAEPDVFVRGVVAEVHRRKGPDDATVVALGITGGR